MSVACFVKKRWKFEIFPFLEKSRVPLQSFFKNNTDMMLNNDYIRDSVDTYFHRIKVSSFTVYWIFLLIVSATLIMLPFVYVDITMSSSGVIRPEHEKTTVISSVTEFVDSIFVKEGDTVHKGDTILLLSTKSAEHKMRHDRLLIDENLSQIYDLGYLSKGKCPPVFRSMTRQREYNLYLSKRKEIETLVHQVRGEHERNTSLYNQRLISREEYEGTLYKLQNKQDELRALEDTQISAWQTDLVNLSNTNSEYYVDLGQQKILKDQYVVTSPVDGTVEQFRGIYKGSMIQAGTTIANVIPTANMQVECYVSPSDIGFVKKGMPVSIQVSAFNYNEWGKVYGEVTQISSDIIQNGDGSSFFKVLCNIKHPYLTYRQTDKKAYIKKGMSVGVHFILTRRSLFDCLYQNINEWINPSQNSTTRK